MMSLAVTAPPGLLMRNTTALTRLSLAALFSFSRNSESGFSPSLRRPLVRAFMITPSTSMTATLLRHRQLCASFITVSSIGPSTQVGLSKRPLKQPVVQKAVRKQIQRAMAWSPRSGKGGNYTGTMAANQAQAGQGPVKRNHSEVESPQEVVTCLSWLEIGGDRLQRAGYNPRLPIRFF